MDLPWSIVVPQFPEPTQNCLNSCPTSMCALEGGSKEGILSFPVSIMMEGSQI